MKPTFAAVVMLAVSAFALYKAPGSGQQGGATPVQPKVMPFLWFDGNAEEAVKFYLSAFKGGKLVEEARVGEAGPGPKGSLMAATIDVGGLRLVAFNGGPRFKFSEGISLMITCETQQEIDDLWAKLAAGAQARQCGWIKDKFGVWWQVVPAGLGRMFADKDPAKVKRLGEALRKMEKLDMAQLQQAFDGG